MKDEHIIEILENVPLDEPTDRLLYGLQRGVARVIVEQALGLGDAGAGTVGDMVPGGAGLFG